jgi:hypothetical protein
MSFAYKETEIAVLKNLATISPSMLIESDKFSVINPSKSVVATFKFDEPYDYEEFGIYEVPEFLSVLSTLKNPQVDNKDKYLLISDGSSKFKYFTTHKDQVPKAPNVRAKFDTLTYPLDFDISNEKLAMVFKTAAILKADYLFFETDKKKIRLTVANELGASVSSFEIMIDEGIRTNKLESAVKLPIADMKLYQGDYKVKLTEKISLWENTMGNLEYFIGTASV